MNKALGDTHRRFDNYAAAKAAALILAIPDVVRGGSRILAVARGLLADVAHHQPVHAQVACHVVIGLSDDCEEREDARALLSLLEGTIPRERIDDARG